MSDEAKWYVVHTYSGYENKVASNLEKTVENHSLQNFLQGQHPRRPLGGQRQSAAVRGRRHADSQLFA